MESLRTRHVNCFSNPLESVSSTLLLFPLFLIYPCVSLLPRSGSASPRTIPLLVDILHVVLLTKLFFCQHFVVLWLCLPNHTCSTHFNARVELRKGNRGHLF